MASDIIEKPQELDRRDKGRCKVQLQFLEIRQTLRNQRQPGRDDKLTEDELRSDTAGVTLELW